MAFSNDSGSGRAPLGEINVTPFVDVMLVLLIIFMVTAPMMTTGLPVDLPNAEAPTLDQDEQTRIVSVAADGRLALGEEELTLDGLAERLAEDEELRSRGELFVRADDAVPYGDVVRVLAVIRAAGILRMGLVTDDGEIGSP